MYILLEYDEGNLIGVFSTLEKAESGLVEYLMREFDWWNNHTNEPKIEEYGVIPSIETDINKYTYKKYEIAAGGFMNYISFRLYDDVPLDEVYPQAYNYSNKVKNEA